MRKQGRPDRNVGEGYHREPRGYSVNQNFPSQIGSAIDPMAAEKFHEGNPGPGHKGPTDGMGQGPGANRTVKSRGSQGEY